MPELLNEETWESWSYYFGEDEKLSFASVEFTVTVRYCKVAVLFGLEFRTLKLEMRESFT